MSAWVCGIAGCGSRFKDAEDLIHHQVATHGKCRCAVCGASLPEGFVAIRHTFTEHSRADYVRAYGATSDDIRHREHVMELIEEQIDVSTLLDDVGENIAAT